MTDEVVDEPIPEWRIAREAAGTGLHCTRELPEGGMVSIKAPTLDAIRMMMISDEYWKDAAVRAAHKPKATLL